MVQEPLSPIRGQIQPHEVVDGEHRTGEKRGQTDGTLKGAGWLHQHFDAVRGEEGQGYCGQRPLGVPFPPVEASLGRHDTECAGWAGRSEGFRITGGPAFSGQPRREWRCCAIPRASPEARLAGVHIDTGTWLDDQTMAPPSSLESCR